jgi:hypothetical protein
MRKFLAPSMTLLVKIGSIAVHAEEMLSSHGHQFDADAIKSLLADPEVVAWRKEMDGAALLPKKRKP